MMARPILAVMGMVLAAMTAAAVPADGARADEIGPWPVDSDWWRGRHQELLQLAKQDKDKIDVLFLGDSITDNWHNYGAQLWAQVLAPLGAANFGIGGDAIDNVLWRIENGEIDGLHPHVLVLLIGTNNIGWYSADEIAAGHVKLVAELEKRLPDTKLLLLAVFPRVDDWSAPYRAKIATINEKLAQLADGKGAFYLDFGAKFLSADGGISKDIMPDGLHPNENGYRIWLDNMMPQLHALLGH
jgi:lysophospholipase L1-like esterase